MLVLVELLGELLERQALRRMAAGTLESEEVRALGNALTALHSRLEELAHGPHAGARLGRLLGDLAGDARLLDDQIPGVGLDDRLERLIDVAGQDDEAARMLAHALVGLLVDGDVLGAGARSSTRR